MICAIDFGSCWIRSVFRKPETPDRLAMYSEKSEYALLTNSEHHRRTLDDQQIPFAECEGALVVVGNNSAKAQFLSRVPCTALLTDGIVPADDPPARQMLSVLTEAMLPPLSGSSNLCAITVPGLRDGSEQAERNEEFLCRLVRMRGYRTVVVNPAEAALVATCSDASFTGISIVMGAETTTICVARYGMPIAAETIAVGSNWIDSEIARHFRVQTWDDEGICYLDLESVRQWKQAGNVHLRNALGDRERMMARLYSVALDRVSRTVAQMLTSTTVRNALQRQRLSVMLSGGAVMVDGFPSLLTERFIEHDVAERILSVRISSDPATAVIRGSLILAELESRALSVEEAA